MPRHPDAQDCSADVHPAENHRCNIRVLDPHTGEYGCAIIEKVIGPRELLQHLQRHGKGDAVEHAWTGQRFVPGMVAAGGLHDLFDFGGFGLDHGVMFIHAVETGHGCASAGLLAVVPVVAGRFGQEENSHAEN